MWGDHSELYALHKVSSVLMLVQGSFFDAFLVFPRYRSALFILSTANTETTRKPFLFTGLCLSTQLHCNSFFSFLASHSVPAHVTSSRSTPPGWTYGWFMGHHAPPLPDKRTVGSWVITLHPSRMDIRLVHGSSHSTPPG